MLTIFSPYISPRLQYIVTTLFKGSAVLLPITMKAYLSNEGPGINYSDQLIDNGIQISPVPFLKEKGIQKQDINIHFWRDLPIFFSGSGQIPFDIFAAAFYLLSRYEEYTSIMKRINMGDTIIRIVLLSKKDFLVFL